MKLGTYRVTKAFNVVVGEQAPVMPWVENADISAFIPTVTTRVNEGELVQVTEVGQESFTMVRSGVSHTDMLVYFADGRLELVQEN